MDRWGRLQPYSKTQITVEWSFVSQEQMFLKTTDRNIRYILYSLGVNTKNEKQIRNIRLYQVPYISNLFHSCFKIFTPEVAQWSLSLHIFIISGSRHSGKLWLVELRLLLSLNTQTSQDKLALSHNSFFSTSPTMSYKKKASLFRFLDFIGTNL